MASARAFAPVRGGCAGATRGKGWRRGSASKLGPALSAGSGWRGRSPGAVGREVGALPVDGAVGREGALELGLPLGEVGAAPSPVDSPGRELGRVVDGRASGADGLGRDGAVVGREGLVGRDGAEGEGREGADGAGREGAGRDGA